MTVVTLENLIGQWRAIALRHSNKRQRNHQRRNHSCHGQCQIVLVKIELIETELPAHDTTSMHVAGRLTNNLQFGSARVVVDILKTN